MTTDTSRVETLARFDYVTAELWDAQPSIVRDGVTAKLRLYATANGWTEAPDTEPQVEAHPMVSRPRDPDQGPRVAWPNERPDLYMIRTTMRVYRPGKVVDL